MFDELIKKHPAPMLATPGGIVAPDTPPPVSCHPAIFDCLDEHLIRRTALRIGGAAGPSGLDAHGWRRLCTSFHNASVDLCCSLALVARRIATSFLDPDALRPLLNGRLIALDKHPGVHPIRIGEVSCRLISKAFLQVIKA